MSYNEFQIFLLSKYLKKNNMNISKITDPSYFEFILKNTIPNITMNVSDLMEFEKLKTNINKYSFWNKEYICLDIDICFEMNKAVDYIKNCSSIIISSGAGISVSSNLPCYNNNITNLSLNDIIYLCKNAEPSSTYTKLYNLINDKPYFIFTSNIDSLFLKTGFDETLLCECHGNYSFKQCINNCNSLIIDNNENICIECGKELRENILRYGDKYFNDSRLKIQETHFKNFLDNNTNICIIEIGCGITTPTVRDYDDILTEDRIDIKLIRVNPIHYYIDEKLRNKSCMINMTADVFLNTIESLL